MEIQMASKNFVPSSLFWTTHKPFMQGWLHIVFLIHACDWLTTEAKSSSKFFFFFGMCQHACVPWHRRWHFIIMRAWNSSQMLLNGVWVHWWQHCQCGSSSDVIYELSSGITSSIHFWLFSPFEVFSWTSQIVTLCSMISLFHPFFIIGMCLSFSLLSFVSHFLWQQCLQLCSVWTWQQLHHCVWFMTDSIGVPCDAWQSKEVIAYFCLMLTFSL